MDELSQPDSAQNSSPPDSAASPAVKGRFISELVANERFTATFLVKSKEVRLKKSGEPFLSLLLGDRTGEVDAKMWDNVEPVQDSFDRDDFVKVRGAVIVFRNRPQIQIHKLRRLEEHEIELSDYLPATAFNIDEMFAELRGYVAQMRNEALQALINAVLDDPAIAERLKRAPAAKSLHHAFFGGLLEHVISLCRLARLVVQNYPQVDSDLLLAGIVFHDLGKISELTYGRTFAYSTEGQLLGHMILVLDMLHAKLRQLPDFPRPLAVLLEHMIISHHGRHEFGSPKLPMFPEALLLHYLDDLDSKMQSMVTVMARDGSVEGEWTGFSSSLERPLLRVDRWLNPPVASAAPTQPVPVNNGTVEARTVIPSALAHAAGAVDGIASAPAETLEQRAERLRAALRGETR